MLATVSHSQEVSNNDRLAATRSLVYLLQGEELRVSRDFVVALDAEALRVSLINLGIIAPTTPEELSIVLIQPNSVAQEVDVGADGTAIFEHVRTGLGALLVLGKRSGSAAAQSTAYSALAFFAKEKVEGVDPVEPLQVFIGEVDTRALVSDVRGVATSSRTDQLRTLQDYRMEAADRFRVSRQADGSLIGQIQSPQTVVDVDLRGVVLSFLQQGRLIARAVSAADGSFHVASLPSGFYTVVAAGPAGHACFSFELVEFEKAATQSRRGSRTNALFVAQQVAVSARLNVLLIPPALMAQVQQFVADRYRDAGLANLQESIGVSGLAAAAVATGLNLGASSASPTPSANQRGAGGGAGGSVGQNQGVVGGLLGAAGLATGVASLANGDDGFSTRQGSPIMPN